MTNGNYAFVFGETERNLLAYYGIYVTGDTGMGMPPAVNVTLPYALGDGEYFQRSLAGPRVVQLACTFNPGTSTATLASARKKLIADINRDARSDGTFLLRYYGSKAATAIDLAVRYDGGLELEHDAESSLHPFALRLLAVDPFWRGSALQTVNLAQSAALTGASYVAQCSALGVWGALAASGRPTAVPGEHRSIARDVSGNTYFAIGAKVYKYNGSAWSSWTVTGGDAVVYGLALAPNRTTLYIGGSFTAVGGVSITNAAQLNGSTWTAICANPPPDVVSSIVVSSSGGIYVTSELHASALLKQVGDNWTAVDAPGGAVATWAQAACADGQGHVFYADGTDKQIRRYAEATNSVDGYWAFTGDEVTCTAAAPNGDVYIGGIGLTAIGGQTISKVAYLTAGVQWHALPSTINNNVYSIAFDASGNPHITGWFTSPCSYAMRLINGSWRALDILPAGNTYGIDITDGVITIGYNTASDPTVSGPVTITNAGDRSAYPTITISRSGGTGLALTSIANTTTGDQLLFDYDFLDGETLTINCTPGSRAVTSSVLGNVLGALLPGSQLSTWCVSPGANAYRTNLSASGSPTVTAQLTYYPSYWSCDGVAD